MMHGAYNFKFLESSFVIVMVPGYVYQTNVVIYFLYRLINTSSDNSVGALV